MLTLVLVLNLKVAFGQTITGQVKTGDKQPVEAMIFLDGTNIQTATDAKGRFSFINLNPGNYKVVAFVPGYRTTFQEIKLVQSESLFVDLTLQELETELDEVTISQQREEQKVSWLESVSGAAIYEGKKTELIEVDKLIGNKAANVGRQIFGRVPGLNIWENDAAGINLGIGGRGLNPNRTSNFNVRQNGYDISADALGYPESYYTPAIQALERIELVRGAAGLQYGTQFGGMLNFVFKQGPADKKIQLTSTQSAGSFGLFNSFNSLGGTVGKVNYYTFYQYKTSTGWRPNSEQDQHNMFASVTYKFNPFLSVKLEHTHMTYLAHQPGGLTDEEFKEDPIQSNRNRNWFQVGWDLTAMEWDYRLNNHLKFNNRTFMLNANRYAVGNLEFINKPDDETANRNLLKDEYHNWGNEFRAVYHYNLLGLKSVLLAGNRIYFGKTDRKQGEGNPTSDADFSFTNVEGDYSSYIFPNVNVAAFVENIFNINPKLSITPGIRYEYISTNSDGYYYYPITDFAGNVVGTGRKDETRENTRDFFIAGIGASYKLTEQSEVYTNFSQNYKAINFNDIRVINPSLTVDENIKDEFGYNADLGFRGKRKFFKYDLSVFYLRYNDRIGPMLSSETGARYRTNVGDANIYGLESYVEGDLLKLFTEKPDQKLVGFVNLALIKSLYIHSKTTGIAGNEVELVPLANLKTGLTYSYKTLSISSLFTYVSQQYSDASNTEWVVTAVEGIIPAYTVMDLSAAYRYKWLSLEAGINNLLDQSYFTRRAAGYPGPGIIPASPRNYYFGLGVKF